MFVSIVRFILGFLAAALVAGVTQVLFVTGLDGLRIWVPDLIDSMGLLALLAATQSAVFSLPFAMLAAVMASWLAVRSRFYYMGVGLAIGLGGFLAQHVGEAGPNTIYNRYALTAYAISGLAAGFVYWLVGVPKRRKAAPGMPEAKPEPRSGGGAGA